MKNTFKYILIISASFIAGFLTNMSINISFDDILSNGIKQASTELWEAPSNSINSQQKMIETGKNILPFQQ